VNCLAILQENDSQNLARLGDSCPLAYAPVRLDLDLLGVRSLSMRMRQSASEFSVAPAAARA
jgi:hypothetical protein